MVVLVALWLHPWAARPRQSHPFTPPIGRRPGIVQGQQPTYHCHAATTNPADAGSRPPTRRHREAGPRSRPAGLPGNKASTLASGNQAGRARLRRQRRLAPSTTAASAASSTETGSRPPGRRRLAALLRRCATGTRASSSIAPGDQHHRHRKPGCPGRRPGPSTNRRLKRLHALRITPRLPRRAAGRD